MDEESIDSGGLEMQMPQQGEEEDGETAAAIGELTGDAEAALVTSSLTDEPQYIIVTPTEDGFIHAGTELLQQGGKRFRLEQGDGQTFVLSLAEDDKTLSEDGKDLEDGEVLLPASPDAMQQDDSQDSSDSMTLRDPKDVSQAWFTTKDDKRQFHNKGCNWKQGQWSKEEVDVLQTNITTYCLRRGIPDPAEIIFEMSKDERKDFYRTIAKGLQRPLFSVYRRVVRMYDNRNHIGKYSTEELQKLKELRTKHGSDWATIGASLGRSASSVKDRCRLMKETCNSGKWLPEEEKRLEAAVYELSGCNPGEEVVSGLSWAQVAEKVATRSEKQCRTKWLNYLNWKTRGGKEWTREDEIKLVLKIIDLKVSEESEIEWSTLCKGWSSARSPQWLRGKWWSLKRHVPDYQHHSFTEIVEYLRSLHTQNIRVKPATPAKVQAQAQNQVEVPKITHMTFVPVQEDGSIVTGLTDEDSESATNAYEAVLQSLASSAASHPGAFLIAQSQSNIALNANIGTDHIIVHTLPVAQLQGNENVTVQTIPQSQTIINTADQVADGEVTTLQLDSSITESQDLHTLTVTDGIEGEIITSQDGYEVQTVGVLGITINGEVSQSSFDEDNEEAINCSISEDMGDVVHSDLEQGVQVSGDLVLVSSASPQFVSTSTSSLIHMSSLADPMLTSDAHDLIGSCSDMETEKVQSHDTEADHEDVGSPS